MSFKKFSAAESQINMDKSAEDKTAELAQAAPVSGPQEKPAETVPSAEAPSAKS